ncbi:hypothetical protein D3C73_1201700 [compost metagenome]
MRDGVDAGGGHINPNADTTEADLIAFHRIFGREGRFHGADVSQVDAARGIDDGTVAGKPERFVGKVGRENDRLGVVENTGIGIQQAHVGWRTGHNRSPGTDSLGQAQIKGPTVRILVPGSEIAVGRHVGAGVYSKHGGLGGALGQCTYDQGDRRFGQ